MLRAEMEIPIGRGRAKQQTSPALLQEGRQRSRSIRAARGAGAAAAPPTPFCFFRFDASAVAALTPQSCQPRCRRVDCLCAGRPPPPPPPRAAH